MFQKLREKAQRPEYLLTAVFLFHEVVLKEASGSPWLPEILFTFLFSLVLGCIGCLICTLFNQKTNKIIESVILTAEAAIFITFFFLYRQFGVFYDIRTVLAGAGGVMSSFTDNIKHMVFCADGIIHIILFLLPLFIYLFFIPGSEKRPWKDKVPIIFLAVSVWMFNMVFIIGSDVYQSALKKEYSFQTSVRHFGLLYTLQTDLIRNTGSSKTGFTAEETPEPTEKPEETPLPTETPVVYKKNVMNIRFSSLDQSDPQLVEMDTYVQSLTPSSQNEYTGMFKGKNLIMITAEAFSEYVISEELTPTLYRMMTKGIQFKDYYQPDSAGTTGGEFQIVFGMLPTAGGNSFIRRTGLNNIMTMGFQLNLQGYNGWAFHANSATFYDRINSHNSIGYSNGFMGYGTGMEEYVENVWPQSDVETVTGTFPLYADKTPFNVYYMTVSGHNEYTLAGNAMARKNYDRTEGLPYGEEVRSYFAANLELEDAVTFLIKSLEEKGLADDTVIVLSADHFPYGLENQGKLEELYGFVPSSELERDHNVLMIWSGCLEKQKPIVVDTPVVSMDILPTLLNLFGCEWDSRLLPGRDVFSEARPLAFNLSYDWKTDLGLYRAASGTFIPNDENAEIPEGYVDTIRDIVRNKIEYCRGFSQTDYYSHVFPDE